MASTVDSPDRARSPSLRADDPYRLDDVLTDAECVLRDRIRAFGDEHVLPVINDYWERAEFPFELIGPLRELNVMGATIEGHGCPGLSRRAAGIVARELARIDGSLNTFYGVHSSLAMGSVALLGSAEQRERWLGPMARLEAIGAFALTEPEHGSDSVSLATRARRDGEEWVLDGDKRWIGNASLADVVIVWARNDDGDVGGFLVETDPADPPAGFDPSRVIEGKIGKRAILQAEISLRGVRVPAANRLEGARSFKDTARVLAATRGGAAWECVGHAMAAMDAAVTYAAEREQFGRPIAGFQLVQGKLATMASELVAMQLYCLRLAELQDLGQASSEMASMAKLHNVRKAKLVCAEARDIMAGNGLLLENHVARHMTDMDIVDTYEGTDSIQSLIVGRGLTGISAFT